MPKHSLASRVKRLAEAMASVPPPPPGSASERHHKKLAPGAPGAAHKANTRNPGAGATHKANTADWRAEALMQQYDKPKKNWAVKQALLKMESVLDQMHFGDVRPGAIK